MVYVQPIRCAEVAVHSLVILILALFQVGCVAAPQLDVTEHRLGQATDAAQRVEFVVEVSNSSDVAVSLREIEYRLQLDGQTVYSGRRAAQSTLPAGGTVQLVLPAIIAREQSARIDAERYQLGGNVSYITPGVLARLLRDVGMPRPRVSFSDSGELNWAPTE